MRSFLLALGALLLSSACAMNPRAPGPNHATIIVHNPSLRAVAVRVCGPLNCSAFRTLRAGGASRFYFDASRGERAVVTAMIGARVVDQQPVDLGAGQALRLTLNVP